MRYVLSLIAVVIGTSSFGGTGVWLRKATMDDFQEIVHVENRAWPSELRASSEKLHRRLGGAGETYLAFANSQLQAVGSITVVRITDFNFDSPPTWEYYAHLSELPESMPSSSNAKYLYVVSIGATPDAPEGTGQALFSHALQEAKAAGMRGVLSGVRIPGFAEFRRQSSRGIDCYLELLGQNQLGEPAYGAAVRSGAQVIRALPNYYDDPESENYGVLMFHPVTP